MYSIKKASELLDRPYATVYKLVRELDISPGKKKKSISQADMEVLREELEKRQERVTLKDRLDKRLDNIEDDLSALLFIQESQSRAVEQIKEYIRERL